MGSLWEGQRVRLRAVEPGDLESFVANDEDTDGAQAGWRVHPPRSAWATGAWIEQQTQAGVDGDEFRVVIEALATGEAVGTLNTHTCDPYAGTCSYGLAVFPWHRRHGYASDAVVIVLRFLFGERRYQKCTVGVTSFNEASIGLHRRLGFVEEGRVRRSHFRGGRHYDEVLLGITAEEYDSRWALPVLGEPHGPAEP